MPASDPRLVAIEWARLEGQRPRPAGSNARLGEHGSKVSVPLARAGLIDVIQTDLYDLGFSGWLNTGRLLDTWGTRSAPHHYGTHYGNYAACHLAGAIRNFVYVEWDEAATPGLAAPGYVIESGLVQVPDAPGFGLELDDRVFGAAVEANGFRVIV